MPRVTKLRNAEIDGNIRSADGVSWTDDVAVGKISQRRGIFRATTLKSEGLLNRVTELAILREHALSVLRLMTVVVAAEAARTIDVTDIRRVGAPSHLHGR